MISLGIRLINIIEIKCIYDFSLICIKVYKEKSESMQKVQSFKKPMSAKNMFYTHTYIKERNKIRSFYIFTQRNVGEIKERFIELVTL